MSGLRKWLNETVMKNHTPAGRVFYVILQVLILLAAAIFIIRTFPETGPRLQRWLEAAETTLALLFTAEYLLRLAVAESPVRYVFSFFGLVDLLAVLPFWLGWPASLLSIRVVRFLRFFGIFDFTQCSRALKRFQLALALIKQEILLFYAAVILFIYLFSVGIYFFEHPVQPDNFTSFLDALWWAVETLSLVGYGDIYPLTWGGKAFTFAILMLGLLAVAVPSALMSSALSEVRMKENENPEKQTDQSRGVKNEKEDKQ